jgi:hypothetical protein
MSDPEGNALRRKARQRRPWHPPWYRSVRWWNLALVIVSVAGIVFIILPFKNSAYRQGFSGNLVSSAWQLMASALVAGILYQRFRAERLKQALSTSWDGLFDEMNTICQSLYQIPLDGSSELRTALNVDVRKQLSNTLARISRKISLFGKFLEIEQLADIDRACDAADILIRIDDRLPDGEFMTKGIGAIYDIHISCEHILRGHPSQQVMEKLFTARNRWAESRRLTPNL